MSAHESQDQNTPTPATPLADSASVNGGTSKSSSAPKPKGPIVAPKPAPYYRQFGHGPKY